MARFITVIIAMVISTSAYALNIKDSGFPADDCIAVSNQADGIVFRNTCNKDTFVLWGGEFKYTNKRCGDMADGSFYTHSFNIKNGESVTQTIMGGNYKWAACTGRIGFGNDGAYKDLGGGRITCLAR